MRNVLRRGLLALAALSTVTLSPMAFADRDDWEGPRGKAWGYHKKHDRDRWDEDYGRRPHRDTIVIREPRRVYREPVYIVERPRYIVEEPRYYYPEPRRRSGIEIDIDLPPIVIR